MRPPVGLLAVLLLAAPALAESPPAAPLEEAVAAPAPGSPPRILSPAASDPIAIVVGTAVQFSDTSAGGPSFWSWDFSFDGVQPQSESTAQNPIHTFQQTGVWPVRLEVCNVNGCSSAVQDVTVVEPCTLEDDVVLPGALGSILDSQLTYEACHSISTSGDLSIVQGGDVTMRAGQRVVFSDGFSVSPGGKLVVEIDFRLNTP